MLDWLTFLSVRPNAMLFSIKTLLANITGAEPPARFQENDYRVAAAALLVHAISIDGHATSAESDKLARLVERQFQLDTEAAAELIREATAAENEAVDLYRFTSLINRACDDDGRRRIIEMMWDVVMEDGHVGEFEDNLLWRVADLLNISSHDRIEIRRRVATRQKAEATDAASENE